MERKFIDLKDLKLSDEGPGVIEGYRSVFGVLDEGGDIILKGAFADTVDSYLREGFTAHSHDWNFDKAVGFPIEAREDDYGWFVRSQFHSTPDAQAIRTKAKERLAAGKQVGFSFGYQVDDFSEIQSKDFNAELSKYIPAEQLGGALAKAKRFPRIRILKKLSVIEDSIVTAPMNRQAAATAVKEKPLQLAIVEEEETKTIRKCKPEDMQPGKPWCLYSEDGSELLGRHATREECVEQERAIEANKSSLKGTSESESFESFESAVAALTKFRDNMQRNHDNRTKEGRVLSASNRATVQKCKDSLMELMGDLDALLAMSEPKPKEKDVETLRTQSLRMRSLAIQALARPSST